ncbi:MAG: hypothetical protein WB723_06340, partial [Candidatus Acidiferrales bacterium]
SYREARPIRAPCLITCRSYSATAKSLQEGDASNLRFYDRTKIVTTSENEKVSEADASPVSSMQRFVATSANRDQISLGIVTECAAPFQMVNIKILETATYLTAPVVARQDFFA